MGMDVYGKNAKNETGEYFRRSVWGWRPLAEYITEVHPDIAAGCRYWQTNDGDGLDAGQALRLAVLLDEDLRTGRAVAYVDQRDAHLKDLGRPTCPHCGGTGVRNDGVGVAMGMTTKVNPHKPGVIGWCNGCDGQGTQDHPDTHYLLEVDDIKEFAAFVRNSGGFEIH